MKPDTAHLVDFVLQQVIDRGTGTGAKLDRPVAGKTGTTENNGDAWFAGYTPDYAAVVWMGYPEGNNRPMDNVHGITVTGGTLPAQIWQQFMSAALADVPPDKFPDPPPTVNATLTVAPANGDPGTTITADGAGYSQCVAGWYVTVGAAQSSVQAGSADDHRSTTVVVQAGVPSGPNDVQAWCDTGAGPQSVAHAAFTVNAPPPPPLPPPPPPSTSPPPNTQPSPTTSTTNTTTSTTTTTRPHP
jgi:membrane carboxypeptidase/penicillin-binding protein